MRRFFANRGRWTHGQWIPTAQIELLSLLMQGWSLRSHRDIEGHKRFELRSLSGETQPVSLDVVQKMRKKRLIETNHKFPSATFLLTGHGEQVAQTVCDAISNRPLTARKFTEKD